MIGESSGCSVFAYVSKYANSSTFIVPSAEVVKAGGTVLSCKRYCEEGYQAKRLLEQSGFAGEAIGSHYKVFMPPRFARTRVKDPDFGVPFLTGSAIAEANVDKSDFISTTRTAGLDGILLEEGAAVVTRSGTIGNVRFITKDIAGCAGTDDLIRIIAWRPDYSTEYYYVFSLSPLGKALITKDTYGGVIDHIEPDHLSEIAIPALPIKLRAQITVLMEEANTLRVTANALLEKVGTELQKTCELPDLAELKVDNLIDNGSEATTFSWTSTQRIALSGQFGVLRLDATYHDPTACALAKHILSRKEGVTLDKVLLSVRNSTLRKRVYVDDAEQGVPLIGGKQLMQLRPAEVKYLSKALTRNVVNETVKEGWTLVSCGGTLARTLFVHRNFEGWALSQDVMRVIPDEQKVFPGFIFAFLGSPYGQIQLAERGYGSVIPRLRDFQFNSIAIYIPEDRGESVHTRVVQAFDARADARMAEDKAIQLFMSAIRDGKSVVESKWGKDY